MKPSRKTKGAYFRDFTFGVEDSLVSTVGLLSGIASGGVDKTGIILTGLVLIIVEGFSMGIGALLSEQTEAEYLKKKSVPLSYAVGTSFVMFISYCIFGLIPLMPYIFSEPRIAFYLSNAASLLALFFLGFLSAPAMHVNPLRNGIKLLVIGGIAIGVGILVGDLSKFVLSSTS